METEEPTWQTWFCLELPTLRRVEPMSTQRVGFSRPGEDTHTSLCSFPLYQQSNTVEPPNNGHIETSHFVLNREVFHSWRFKYTGEGTCSLCSLIRVSIIGGSIYSIQNVVCGCVCLGVHVLCCRVAVTPPGMAREDWKILRALSEVHVHSPSPCMIYILPCMPSICCYCEYFSLRLQGTPSPTMSCLSSERGWVRLPPTWLDMTTLSLQTSLLWQKS